MTIVFESEDLKICENPNDSIYQSPYKFFIKKRDEFKNEYWLSSEKTPELVYLMADALIKGK